MKSQSRVALALAAALMLSGIIAAAPGSAEYPEAMATPPPDLPCPIPTPELFLVEPVTSPTGQLTQVVTVHLGNGEAVTITSESGMFATHGDYDAYSHPATVTIALLTDTIHHLEVFGKVKVVEHDGCTYGGYTLHTDRDRFGAPLTIWQCTYLTRTFYVPLMFRDGAGSSGATESLNPLRSSKEARPSVRSMSSVPQ